MHKNLFRAILTSLLGVVALLGVSAAAGAALGYASGSATPARDYPRGSQYSYPEFCSRMAFTGTMCINARGAAARSGIYSQVWAYGFKGNAGSQFRAVFEGRVSSDWPFDDRSTDAAYIGWAVVNLDKVNNRGANSPYCLSTKAGKRHTASGGGVYYYPMLLATCSKWGTGDRNSTFMVWNHTHPYRILWPRASNDLHARMMLGCIFTDPQRNCSSGDPLIFAPGYAAPRWAHYQWAGTGKTSWTGPLSQGVRQ